MRIMRAAGAAALVLGLLASGGCGDDKVTVKDADGNKVTVDKDGDDVTIKNEDGEVTGSAGTGDLPADFPEDVVPLIDGEIGFAASSSQEGAEGWSVQVSADASIDECYSEAVGKLEDAGLEKENEASFGDTRTGSYASDEFRVSLAATSADDKCSLVYGVQPVAD